MGREAAEEKLRSLGATVTSSVTKNTTALICGAKPGKGKKIGTVIGGAAALAAVSTAAAIVLKNKKKKSKKK